MPRPKVAGYPAFKTQEQRSVLQDCQCVELVFSNIRHLGVDQLSHRRTSLRTPVALEHGGTGSAAAGNPCYWFRSQHLLGGGTINGVGLDHPFDKIVQRVGVIRIQHEARWLLQLGSLLGAEEVACVVCHRSEGEGPAAGANAQSDFLAVRHLRDTGIVRDRKTVRITSNGAGLATGQGGNCAQVSGAECLPSRPVVGKEDVACDLEDYEPEGKNVGRLVVLSAQNLPSDVLAVTFPLNALGSWPRSRKAKVAELEITIECDENVRGLDIKVNEASRVNRR